MPQISGPSLVEGSISLQQRYRQHLSSDKANMKWSHQIFVALLFLVTLTAAAPWSSNDTVVSDSSDPQFAEDVWTDNGNSACTPSTCVNVDSEGHETPFENSMLTKRMPSRRPRRKRWNVRFFEGLECHGIGHGYGGYGNRDCTPITASKSSRKNFCHRDCLVRIYSDDRCETLEDIISNPSSGACRMPHLPPDRFLRSFRVACS